MHSVLNMGNNSSRVFYVKDGMHRLRIAQGNILLASFPVRDAYTLSVYL
jgi:hypothetical protein